jgi:hypothetical protein
MDHYGQRKLFDQICGHVKERVESGEIPDLVFLTGDLANRGNSSEYVEFFESMLSPLTDALGGSSWSGKILAIPGNHDVERTQLPYFDRDAILELHGQAFDPTASGNALRQQFHPRFKNYSNSDITDSPSNWIETLKRLGAVTGSIAIFAGGTYVSSESIRLGFARTTSIGTNSHLASICLRTLLAKSKPPN